LINEIQLGYYNNRGYCMEQEKRENTKKGAIKYLFFVFFQRIIAIGLFVTASGGFSDMRGLFSGQLRVI